MVSDMADSTVTDSDLVSMQRSAAMGQPGSKIPIDRDLLIEIVEEVLAKRALLARFGADLKTVANHAPKPAAPAVRPARRTG
jgi:hypothetical protein